MDEGEGWARRWIFIGHCRGHWGTLLMSWWWRLVCKSERLFREWEKKQRYVNLFDIMHMLGVLKHSEDLGQSCQTNEPAIVVHMSGKWQAIVLTICTLISETFATPPFCFCKWMFQLINKDKMELLESKYFNYSMCYSGSYWWKQMLKVNLVQPWLYGRSTKIW